jgi:hypothetical protein
VRKESVTLNALSKFALIVIASVFFFACKNSPHTVAQQKPSVNSAKDADDSALLKEYAHSELRTNFSKHSVPLDSIRDGGVGKNDIPAVDYPEFVDVTNARGFLTEPDYGILLDIGGEQKFYPFNILNWHEVVNDVIDDSPVLVTFCPLCGSAIVYDRVIDGDTLLFGVSGRLYESNLLMFDEKTESLWSQALGECVVGDWLGKKLPLVNSVVVSFEEIENNFPDAKVLSTKTGFDRNYSEYPYADYNSNDELYFPVSKKSKRYANKDMMYVVQIGNTSVAFHWKDLLKAGSAEQNTPDGRVKVQVKNFVPSATKKENGEKLSGYFSYWFSWYAMLGEKGIVWGK